MDDRISYLNSNYEVTIPPSVRKELDLSPGQKVAFVKLHGSFHLVPVRPIEEARGSMKGKIKDPRIIREPDRIL